MNANNHLDELRISLAALRDAGGPLSECAKEILALVQQDNCLCSIGENELAASRLVNVWEVKRRIMEEDVGIKNPALNASLLHMKGIGELPCVLCYAKTDTTMAIVASSKDMKTIFGAWMVPLSQA